jgi:hypothetical protein
MTWNAAASGSSGLFEDGFGWGGVLLVVGMVVALAVVSGLGILARLRDRAGERKAFADRQSVPPRQPGSDPATG